MNLLELYKNMYEFELKRKSEIYNALNIPIASLTLIVSASFYQMSNFNYYISNTLTVIFLLFSVILLVFFFITICFLGYCFKGYEYKAISDIIFIDNYYNDLLKHKEMIESNDYECEPSSQYFEPQEEFIGFFKAVLVRTTSYNKSVNDKIYDYMFKAKRTVVMSLFLLVFQFVPYSINQVYILKIKGEIMSKETTTESSKKPPLPPPPQPPSESVFKEGVSYPIPPTPPPKKEK